MVLAIVVLAVLVAGGVRKRHLAVVVGLGITRGHLPRARRAVPARRACSRSSTRSPTRSNTGYQISQSLIALGSGGLHRRRARRGPGQVELPPQRAHRLHLRHHRRGARAHRLLPGAGAVHRLRGARCPRRAARARPVRRADRRRRHGVGRRPGGHQHRRGRRAAARDRHPAAVRVVRRFGADHHHARRPASSRTSPARAAPPAGTARRARAPPPVPPATAIGDRDRRPDQRRRHRRPRLPRARARRGARRARARSATRCASSARSAGLEATAVPAAGFAIDLLPGRGLERSASAEPRSRRTSARRATPRSRSSRVRGWCDGSGRASSSASAGTRRSRRWSRRALVRIPTVVHEADAHPGLANRIAVRLGRARRGDPARHAAARGGRHRQPDPPRDRRGRADPGGPAPASPSSAAAWAPGRSTGRRSGSTTAGATAPTSRSTTSRAPATTKSASTTLADAAASGRPLSYRLVPFEEHMEVVYAEATLVVSPRGRDDRRAHRRRHARGAGAAAGRARRPPDRQRPTPWSRPAPRSSSPTPSSTRPGSTAELRRRCSPIPTAPRRDGRAASTLGRPDADRPLRRPGGGGGRVRR